MDNLVKVLINSINELHEEFTTHELIILLAKNNQHAYIQALIGEMESSKPFQTLHGKIGKCLKNKIEFVEHIGDKSDVDIFGTTSPNALWRKLQ